MAVAAVGFLDLSGAAAAQPAAPAPGKVACVDKATTAAAAAEVAAACDSKVEIVGKRTGTDQFFAQPDGTTTLRRYAVPQRVRRGDGWVPQRPTRRWRRSPRACRQRG